MREASEASPPSSAILWSSSFLSLPSAKWESRIYLVELWSVLVCGVRAPRRHEPIRLVQPMPSNRTSSSRSLATSTRCSTPSTSCTALERSPAGKGSRLPSLAACLKTSEPISRICRRREATVRAAKGG